MIVRVILIIITFLLLSSHFFRDGNLLLSIASLVIPFLLFVKKKWCLIVVQLFIYGGVIVWTITLINLINERINIGMPWIRMAIILFAVILLTLTSLILLNSKIIKERYK